MIFKNCTSTNLRTGVTSRHQLDDQPVEHMAFMQGVPLLQKAYYTDPGVDIVRGDSITVSVLDGEPVLTPPLTFTVWRVQRPHFPLPNTEAALAAPDVLQQTITRFPIITQTTAGATRATDYDATTQVERTFSDGSYGVGWQVGTRLGYLAGSSQTIGFIDSVNTYERLAAGLTPYEDATLVFLPTQMFRKGDVVVLANGFRGEIGDPITPLVLAGVVIGYACKVNMAIPTSIIYTIT